MKGKFNLGLIVVGVILISFTEAMIWKSIDVNNTLSDIEQEKIGLIRIRKVN